MNFLMFIANFIKLLIFAKIIIRNLKKSFDYFLKTYNFPKKMIGHCLIKKYFKQLLRSHFIKLSLYNSSPCYGLKNKKFCNPKEKFLVHKLLKTI